ncbi:hypothetical protein ACE15K_15100 [Citrobacter farmeri]
MYFPSPAADYTVERMSLDSRLIPRPSSTYLMLAAETIWRAGIMKDAILDIVHLVTVNRNQLVAIRNCIFNKVGMNITAGRILMLNNLSAGTMSTKAILEMTGNRFYSGANNADPLYPDVTIDGFQILRYGHAEFCDYDNLYTSNIQVVRDGYVVWKKSTDDGLLCRRLSAGGFTLAASRNIISVTRQSLGTYRIITNQLTNGLWFFSYTRKYRVC